MGWERPAAEFDEHGKRVRHKKFSDFFSVKPALKMIGETKSQWGKPNFSIQIPHDNQELCQEMLDSLPISPNFHKTQSFDGQEVDIYHLNGSAENMRALYAFGKRHRFTFDSDIAVRAQSASEDGQELLRMSSAKSNSVFELPKFGLKPYPHQVAGVAYMVRAKKCFNADEMGLGKTGQGIMATAVVKGYPALVICPATLKINWQKEWNMWCPKRKNSVLIPDNNTIKTLDKGYLRHKKGGKKNEFERCKWDVVIVNYDMLHRWVPYLLKTAWKVVIFDEVHNVKNAGAVRTKAALDLTDFLDAHAREHGVEPPYIWGLTGTPIQAHPRQLVPQLRVMHRLEDFGGRGNFDRRYGFVNSGTELDTQEELDVLAQQRFANLTELHTQMRSTCYVRREKCEVLTDLPRKTRTIIYLDLPKKFRELYERVERDTIAFMMEKAARDQKFLKMLEKQKLTKEEKLLAIAQRRSDARERAANAEILIKIEMCKQVAAMGKLRAAEKWIEDFLESDEKLVCFATHREIIYHLLSKFPDAVTVMGGQSAASKDYAVTQFQTNKKCNKFFGSVRAGGVGLTLTAASNVCFLELAWGPTDHDQAEDRCHRIGQKDNVTAWYLIARDTIEEKIAQLIESKRMVVNAVHDGDALHHMSQGNIYTDLIRVMTGGKVVLLDREPQTFELSEEMTDKVKQLVDSASTTKEDTEDVA